MTYPTAKEAVGMPCHYHTNCNKPGNYTARFGNIWISICQNHVEIYRTQELASGATYEIEFAFQADEE